MAQSGGTVAIPSLDWVSGSTYRPVTATTTTATMATNTTYYTPIFISGSFSLDRISLLTSATFSGTASVRLGIYADTAGKPSTLILDAGTVAPTASSTAYSITISQTISAAGVYWLAINSQTIATVNSYAAGSVITMSGTPTTSGITTQNMASYAQTGVTGAFANAVPTSASVSIPLVFVRRA